VSADFVPVLETDSLPAGRMARVEAHGRRVLVVNVDGTIYAVADTCTHEDASLSQGALSGHCVRCPLHGSRFDVRTGAAVDEPAEIDLDVFPVTVASGWIRVGPAD
jgi:3-phenylpropionate/trans-cinnamate dioxygenase ferredoxin subunit